MSRLQYIKGLLGRSAAWYPAYTPAIAPEKEEPHVVQYTDDNWGTDSEMKAKSLGKTA